MTGSISFFVPGIPAPGGSKTGFGFHRPNGSIGVRLVDAGKRNKEWRATVATVAAQAMNGTSFFDGALRLDVDFMMVRPKGHYGKNGLRNSAPTHHTTRPDRTKLCRSTEDAMTGIVWRDDAQICTGEVRKLYADHGAPSGARITITPLSQEINP